MRKKINSEGQVVIVILLLFLIVLSIGLIMTQKTLTDLTISSKTEQSQRAFSAAEAGIERSLSQTPLVSETQESEIPQTELGNESNALYEISKLLPNKQDQALEYPPISRGAFAHFWLADPKTLAPYYTAGKIKIFFGETNPDLENRPGLAVTVVTRNKLTGAYTSQKKYFDSVAERANEFNFTSADCLGSAELQGKGPVTTTYATNRFFYCETEIDLADPLCPDSANCYPVLLRTRLLYSKASQPIALKPISTDTYLPRQASVNTAVGRSGQTEKKLQV
ncbi:hypothetical protein HYS97_01165, partial [Candidatus Daviesbacteria bacterium]|nr:hypothetical protein [Candidatus Daviesbacteria bacterium]